MAKLSGLKSLECSCCRGEEAEVESYIAARGGWPFEDGQCGLLLTR